MSLNSFSLGMNIFHFEAFTLSTGKSRFQTTNPHIFGLVGKVLTRIWFLAQLWQDLNKTLYSIFSRSVKIFRKEDWKLAKIGALMERNRKFHDLET
jgi:hypothetical protein